MAQHQLQADTVFNVLIDGVNTDRHSLTITTDAGAGTLTVTNGPQAILTAVLYSDLLADGSMFGFDSYADMDTWVDANMRYNVVSLADSGPYRCSIQFHSYMRHDLAVTYDEGAGTVTVTAGADTILPATLYSGLYVTPGTVPFTDFDSMQVWFDTFVGYNIVSLTAVDIFTVGIDYTNHNRNDLTITPDEGAGTLTVTDGDTLIDEVYSNIYADGALNPFDSFADLMAWVNANMSYNVITVTSEGLNVVKFNEVTVQRLGLSVTYDVEAGTVTVAVGDDDPISSVYSNLVTTDYPNGFPSFVAMRTWFNTYVVFRGSSFARSDTAIYVNGKPYFKNELHRQWYDAEQSLELRFGHYDLGDQPMIKTRYDTIIADGSDTPFASYAALISYIERHFLA